MTIDQDITSIHGSQHVGINHVMRRAEAEKRAGLQHQNSIAVLARKIQVVGDEHHGQAAFLFQPAHNRADFNLVLDIEKRGGLIQQEDLGRLRQGPGNHATLAFTARKIHHRTAG